MTIKSHITSNLLNKPNVTKSEDSIVSESPDEEKGILEQASQPTTSHEFQIALLQDGVDALTQAATSSNENEVQPENNGKQIKGNEGAFERAPRKRGFEKSAIVKSGKKGRSRKKYNPRIQEQID